MILMFRGRAQGASASFVMAVALSVISLLVTSCTAPVKKPAAQAPNSQPANGLEPPPAAADSNSANPKKPGGGRVNGPITPETPPENGPLIRENGTGAMVANPHQQSSAVSDNGEVTLNYVDTDIRELARVILGTILKVNYSVQPGLQGTVTIQTARPLKREELLPTFESLLNQAGATMTYEDGMFKIGPAGDTAVIPPVIDAASVGSGSMVVPLRYASAKQLAAMLEPYVGDGAKLLADPARNVLVVSGTVEARSNLIDLIKVFDVDYLAGQSYALFPAKSSDPDKVAADLQHALQLDSDGPLAGALQVVPIEQANAIMVIAERPSYLDRAARLIAQINQVADTGGRNLHVYYLKNVQAKDLQPVLQRAINPPSGGGGGEAGPGNLPPTAEPAQINAAGGAGGNGGNGGIGGIAGTAPGNSAAPGASPVSGGGAFGANPGMGQQGNSASGATQSGAAASSANAQTEETEAAGANAKGPQIIADSKSNALIIVATEDDYAKIEAAIRKLDILPLQVLIEATVAEVTLNHDLEYGVQFYLNNHVGQVTLSNAQSSGQTAVGSALNSALFPGTLAPAFPGFAVARTVGGVQAALEALKTITNVEVISAPKLLILDRQEASLQVGDLVPITTQSADVLTGNGTIVNSVQYQPTGVILNVTPRINSGGLVTLDIDQEVSQVQPTTSSTINSPTFQQRVIKSKIVVQDGETVSLAGLITDTKSKSNNGVPLLQDIPIVGTLFSTRTNNNDRTELLVLITPHVVYDQRDARALTEELRRKLIPGALIQ